MTEIALSRNQAHEADRRGGLDLVLRWPVELGTAPALERDERRLASGAVQTWAHQALAQAIAHHGLVVLGIYVAHLYAALRVGEYPKSYQPVIVVHLATERWAQQSRGLRGSLHYSEA